MTNIEPKFDKINKLNVAISSLRNQLKTSISINEILLIASKIIELEQSVCYNRLYGCKELENKRNHIIYKIIKLKRQLTQANKNLIHIENSLDYKLNRYH
jgi:predicted NAD-dependent protein-ADP-ribosyltransferase YbiA (DUF1768 family)